MTFDFTPTNGKQKSGGVKVPLLEDARADFAPYYDIRDKSVEDAQREVRVEFAKLDGLRVEFEEGYFGWKPKRYGFVVDFVYLGAKAQMQIAGLPMGTETPNKIKRVQLQALMNLRDWLKAAVTVQVFTPGAYPLMQYLLVDNGTRTLGQRLIEEKNLAESNPMLETGK